MKEWYVQIDGDQVGPYGETVLQELAQTGELQADHLVWSEGMSSWQAARTMSFLQGYLSPAPPAAPAPAPIQVSPTPVSPPAPVAGYTASSPSRSRPSIPPVSVGDWVLTMFLMTLPLVNFILLIVWAVDGSTNPSKRNWARATFVWMAIIFGIYVLFFLVVGFLAAADY